MFRKVFSLIALGSVVIATQGAVAQPGMHDRGYGRGDRMGPANGPDRYDGGYEWRRGDYYHGPRDRRWIVRDWHRHHGLYAPPQGYYWIQSGGQYLLTAVGSGLIAGVVGGTVVATPVPQAYGPPPPPPPYGRP
ncbi:hypothetical protein AA101099_0358 [Neoasaia chiangmaiensis NBRC 101099]|uniref:Uncharacterized protein n=1 Tax=Neoasaia chiangmaiensis TaxID=320497 RepID=A0A1U9KS19_9PROT|nr:RcnB family protein [Neoasaia chiangmaiensis]AQS88517.1 hypothetical protein A0U93_11875 [Neoasaia chiangmaiensis]GBR36430.1 hypothetical protein AA101099_0358 [Neoasaia chiangmaiensis NBRC 101099]GEN15347.1 hypothetical protein NCH01_17780 [Neoasaia chiangmaiensis]